MPSGYPTTPDMPFAQNFVDQFFKYAVARDAAAALPDFDAEHLGRWEDRLRTLVAMMDLGDTDLSVSAGRGGKIILLHCMADQIISIQRTKRYVAAVQQRMGHEQVDRFLKFYELPATAHSSKSLVFIPVWDTLGALDAGVVKVTPPHAPVITDSVGKPGRTRPLCEYPAITTYGGSGNIYEAVSFTCVESQPRCLLR